jgi:hypothetical protein
MNKTTWYKGIKLTVNRGHFYTEVKTLDGVLLGRAKTTKDAVIQVKKYLDVIMQDNDRYLDKFESDITTERNN